MASNKILVQKHRAKMVEEGYGRMEVTLARGLIRQSRDLARKKRCSLWEVVQDALIAHLATGKAAQTSNGK